MIYLDNSATTSYKPPCVINAAVSCMEHISANAGRSGHRKSLSAAMLVYRTRQKLARYVGLEGGNVVFTGSCSEALNLAILGLSGHGGHVITTVYEHNSVLRPLHELKRMGRITLSIATPDESGKISFESIRRHIRPDTFLVAASAVSNVTGFGADIAEIARSLRGGKIRLLVDGAQSVGYVDTDMTRTGIDYLSVAPHKGLHGIQGVGALCIAPDAPLPRPIKFGGTGTQSLSLLQPEDPPECYESGTLPLVAIAALNRAIDFCEKNKEEHREKLRTLTRILGERIRQIDGVRLISGDNDSGIVAFVPEKISSEDVCDRLDLQYDIAARGGLHCAPLVHKYLGSVSSGAVRMSLGCDNTEEEILRAASAVKEIVSAYR